jgi:hydrogenase nickel incorporation protein HypB
MKEIKLIDVKQDILSENRQSAEEIRGRLRKAKTFMINFMASPGAGKTSLIARTIERLAPRRRIAVLEGDIESSIDSQRLSQQGIDAIQIRTGGFCHLDAWMVDKALEELDLEDLDVILIENVGNLVCPAEADTGSFRNVVILSVPEGDDKPFKYPLAFKVSDVTVINKIDYPDFAHFDLEAVRKRVQLLNPAARVIPVSCRNRSGLEEWFDWLEAGLEAFLDSP